MTTDREDNVDREDKDIPTTSSSSSDSNDIGKYLSYVKIDIENRKLKVNGNDEYALKIRRNNISLEYISGIITNICQTHDLEYNDEDVMRCAAETYNNYTSEREQREHRMRLHAEALHLAEEKELTDDSIDVELCRKYLEFHGKKNRPSPRTMEAWTPPSEQDDKLWRSFLESGVERQVAALAKAGATDFTMFTQWSEKIKSEKSSSRRGGGGGKVKEAIKLVKNNCQEFFLDQHGQPWAEVAIVVVVSSSEGEGQQQEQQEQNLRPLHIGSGRFKKWLSLLYYRWSKGETLGTEDLTHVANILDAEIDESGKRRTMYVRVAGSIKDVIYYDQTNAKYEAVKITKEGWDIVPSPVIFARYQIQQPQVEPSREYDSDVFEKFWKLTNVKDKDDQLVLTCYIISIFIPEIIKAAPILHGPQGAAKSMLEKYIKKLVDPTSVELLTFPKDVNELVQQLAHNYVAYYDNVSHIYEWVSDLLCRAITGMGFSKRALWTNEDDIAYSFKRAVGLNGINIAATKPDLLHRSLIIKLEDIEDEDRRDEVDDLWPAFYQLRPQLLGFIFDVLVKVLRVIQDEGGIKLDRKPRMSEWSKLCEIISRCMGNPENEFMRSYYRNLKVQSDEVIEGNPLAQCIQMFMAEQIVLEDGQKKERRKEWSGTASDLLQQLKQIASNQLGINTDDKKVHWPRAPNALTRALPHLTGSLKSVNIEVTISRDSQTNLSRITIRKISPVSPESPISPEGGGSRAQNQTALTKFTGDTPQPGQIPPTIPPSSDRARSGGPEISEILSEQFWWLDTADGDGGGGDGGNGGNGKVQKNSIAKYSIIPDRYYRCAYPGCEQDFNDPVKLLSHLKDTGHGDWEQLRLSYEWRGLL